MRSSIFMVLPSSLSGTARCPDAFLESSHHGQRGTARAGQPRGFPTCRASHPTCARPLIAHAVPPPPSAGHRGEGGERAPHRRDRSGMAHALEFREASAAPVAREATPFRLVRYDASECSSSAAPAFWSVGRTPLHGQRGTTSPRSSAPESLRLESIGHLLTRRSQSRELAQDYDRQWKLFAIAPRLRGDRREFEIGGCRPAPSPSFAR